MRIKKTKYTNWSTFKYKNARVNVIALPSDEFAIELKILSDDHKVRASHRVDKNKIVVTGIKISREAAMSIMVGLRDHLY